MTSRTNTKKSIITMRFIISIALIFMGSMAIAQQKYGHLNTGNILESMPAVAKADSVLVIFQRDLQAKEDDMISKFEEEYMDFVKKANAGELPKVAIERKQNEFQQKEQEIIEYQKEAQRQITAKRKELLDPLLRNLQETVDKIAKANNYSYIFDISSGAFLFAKESEDIEPLVRTALGIQ
jgi:outer membrane protein